MKVWVIYKCKQYGNTSTPYPCVIAVMTNMEKAKSVARANGAWMTEIEVDQIGANECKE